MKIMLIDDDAGIRDAVEDIVSEEGYDFVWAGNASQAKALLRDSNPDLIVLDVMLPDVNGFDLCTKLRASHVEIPILFLSAKGDIVDKSIGFKAGGDDYLVKPFNPTELLLRIEALLRRTKKTETTCTQPRDGYLKIGNLEIFFDRYEVLKNGVTTGLSSKEFEIVRLHGIEARIGLHSRTDTGAPLGRKQHGRPEQRNGICSSHQGKNRGRTLKTALPENGLARRL